MKTRLTLAAAVATVALVATPAQAADQTVSGAVTGSALSLAVGVSPSAMTLSPGTTATPLTQGTVIVTSTAPWWLWVKDGGAGGNGKMDLTVVPGVCDATNSATELASALQTWTSGTAAALGSLTVNGTPQNITGAFQNVANGDLTQTVGTNYQQPVGAAELLKGGCTYTETVTHGVSTDAAGTVINP